MGYRLSKLYTRMGDDGKTRLADGERIPKDAPLIQALGDVDELNSLLGVVLAAELPPAVTEVLLAVQNDLFDLGGELAVPHAQRLQMARITWLETQIDQFNAQLAPLKEFILPGGGQTATFCHLARAVCRRAERQLITLSHSRNLSEPLVAYMNRLSDLLFVCARIIATAQGHAERMWHSARTASTSC
ncbi:cob(I)yrinic acid a,c-diamide adenosyltransferase [Thiorhodospira sibirica]|uniref:cob(I)yrinic acid a,c-diamide adenosyltransferase n=1 Tax=Thiorhodospira sibirica TaxID=154347 RepID=UPI00022C22AB|nr:cob(I)yrinic acid a,c-diamide adenosyltransferase [Thiorhodospira sibirica]